MISGMQALLYWICSIWLLVLSSCPQQRHAGGHASFQPYMEGKHLYRYLYQACYEGFWQALWLSSLTLTRPRAQYGKSRKERQMEKSRGRTDSPWRTGRDTHLLLCLYPFILGTSGSFQKKWYQYIIHWYQYIFFQSEIVPGTISIKFEPVSSAKTQTQIRKMCILSRRTPPVM